MRYLAHRALQCARSIQADVPRLPQPPEEGAEAATQQVLPFSLAKGTRGYIERVMHQLNGCYERGWFDACAVMARRLIETVIIESYEHHRIAVTIKNSNGDFLYLRDLVSKALAETTWNLSRNTKQALPRLKDIGDKSAHGRRFVAQKRDIDRIADDLRTVVQEFIYLAGLK